VANDTKIISAEHLKDIQYPQQAAEVADVADSYIMSESAVSAQKHKSYWSLGKWHCSECTASGDKFHMENTNCKGGSKK
jgi:hypothetical protein